MSGSNGSKRDYVRDLTPAATSVHLRVCVADVPSGCVPRHVSMGGCMGCSVGLPTCLPCFLLPAATHVGLHGFVPVTPAACACLGTVCRAAVVTVESPDPSRPLRVADVRVYVGVCMGVCMGVCVGAACCWAASDALGPTRAVRSIGVWLELCASDGACHLSPSLGSTPVPTAAARGRAALQVLVADETGCVLLTLQDRWIDEAAEGVWPCPWSSRAVLLCYVFA